MAEQYNNVSILNKIIDYKFTFKDLNPKLFPQLQTDLPYYCMFHDNSHTGTKQARLYYNEEYNLWYIHCYMEKKSFFAHHYVQQIMIEERKLFRDLKEFILSKISNEEFVSLYNIFKKKRDELIMTQFKRKCEWIDNVYAESQDTVDYIERLYTA